MEEIHFIHGNVKTVREICIRVKQTFPVKDIALWTGYYMDQLTEAQRSVLDYVDYCIDGPFIEEKKNLSLKWRGSSNQRIWKNNNGIWRITNE